MSMIFNDKNYTKVDFRRQHVTCHHVGRERDLRASRSEKRRKVKCGSDSEIEADRESTTRDPYWNLTDHDLRERERR